MSGPSRPPSAERGHGNPPLLVILMGLPGSGKSYLARPLAAALPAYMVQSDVVRKELFPAPRYQASESAAVFDEAHQRIRQALESGQNVLVDATNLQQEHRQIYDDIAARAGVRPFVFWLRVPSLTARERLTRRGSGQAESDASDADWAVYQRMASAVEAPRGVHAVLNATLDVDQLVWAVLRVLGRTR